MTIVESRAVTGGVDTHLDTHVAAALDGIGGLLGVESFPTTPAGYRMLLDWLSSFGTVERVGIEGTGSYGAGLARHLQALGLSVVEVNRADRSARRREGKSDPLDAISAARAALSGRATGTSKGRDGSVEAIRTLMVTKRSARRDRTSTINQMRALVSTAPDDVRTRFACHTTVSLVAEAAAMRPRPGEVVDYATRIALRELGRRAEYLAAQIDRVDGLLGPLLAARAPGLLALPGVGPDSAAILLIAAGDHPERLRSEAAWAHLCGVAPIPAFFSSPRVVAMCRPGGSVIDVGARCSASVTDVQERPPAGRPIEEGPGCRAFRIALPDGRGYWTVVDDDYSKVRVADQFLFDLRFGRDRAESTSRVYAGELAGFLRWCRRSGRSLEEGAHQLSQFVLFLRTTPTARPGAGQGRPPGAERINHVLAVVREFYKHAVAARAVDAEVLAALYEVADDRFLPAELKPEGGGLRYRARPRHRLRASRSARPDAASQQEWEALLEAASSWRDRFLLVLLWFGGLRIGEALGARRADLHFMASSTSVGCPLGGPHLHVVRRDNLNGAWAKSRDSRAVPVGPWVLAYYDRYVEERLACAAADGCDFVFVNLFHPPLGMPMTDSATRQLVRRLGQRAGLARAVTPHMLRHSTATEMVEAGVAVDVVQAVLGHRSITSTQLYARPSPRRMRDAVEAMESASRQRRARRQGGEGR